MQNALSLFDPYRAPMLLDTFVPSLFKMFNRFDDADWYRGGMEIKEVDGNNVVTMPMPGIAAENINVEVKDNVITVTGETKEENNKRSKTSQYYYSFQTDGIDPEQIKATYTNGILELTIPKTQTKEEPKKIPVEIK